MFADLVAWITASKDGSARFWDATTGEEQGRPLKMDHLVWSADFSKDAELGDEMKGRLQDIRNNPVESSTTFQNDSHLMVAIPAPSWPRFNCLAIRSCSFFKP